MPVTDNLKAGSPDRTGTGSIGVLNTDVSLTTFSRALMLAMVLGLHHGSLYAQPTGPGAPGDTPAGGTTRPGDFVPELPQPGTPAEAPIEVPEGVPAPEEEKVPYGIKVFVKEIRLTGSCIYQLAFSRSFC